MNLAITFSNDSTTAIDVMNLLNDPANEINTSSSWGNTLRFENEFDRCWC